MKQLLSRFSKNENENTFAQKNYVRAALTMFKGLQRLPKIKIKK